MKAIKHIINMVYESNQTYHRPTTIHHIKSTNLQFKYIQNECDVNEINLFHGKMLVVSVKIHLQRLCAEIP